MKLKKFNKKLFGLIIASLLVFCGLGVGLAISLSPEQKPAETAVAATDGTFDWDWRRCLPEGVTYQIVSSIQFKTSASSLEGGASRYSTGSTYNGITVYYKTDSPTDIGFVYANSIFVPAETASLFSGCYGLKK